MRSHPLFTAKETQASGWDSILNRLGTRPTAELGRLAAAMIAYTASRRRESSAHDPTATAPQQRQRSKLPNVPSGSTAMRFQGFAEDIGS
mgnify:CR=1 FL=1